MRKLIQLVTHSEWAEMDIAQCSAGKLLSKVIGESFPGTGCV